jgi:hypothetical protein
MSTEVTAPSVYGAAPVSLLPKLTTDVPVVRGFHYTKRGNTAVEYYSGIRTEEINFPKLLNA